MKNEELVRGFEVGLRGAKAAFRKLEKAFLRPEAPLWERENGNDGNE
jgi:hypothetical protein